MYVFVSVFMLWENIENVLERQSQRQVYQRKRRTTLYRSGPDKTKKVPTVGMKGQRLTKTALLKAGMKRVS